MLCSQVSAPGVLNGPGNQGPLFPKVYGEAEHNSLDEGPRRLEVSSTTSESDFASNISRLSSHVHGPGVLHGPGDRGPMHSKVFTKVEQVRSVATVGSLESKLPLCA